MDLPQHTYGKTFRSLAFLVFMLLGAVSCLKDLPESVPNTLEWNPEVAFPLGEDSFGLNAVSGFDTSLLDLDTITGLPDWIDEVEVVMEGTLNFNLSSISDNLDHLNRILFRVNANNGFPNEVLAQAYFQDAGLNTIDSMFSEGPMEVPAGQKEGSGITIQPSYFKQDAMFHKERLQPLANAAVIFFRATIVISDLDSTLIPYYPSYHFDLDIGSMLDLSLEF